MIFDSLLPLPSLPQADVFSYIFRHGRRDYPKDRVLYQVDGTEETLTLGQLERQSQQLARRLKAEYQIQPQDVVAIFSHDLVCLSAWKQFDSPNIMSRSNIPLHTLVVSLREPRWP